MKKRIILIVCIAISYASCKKSGNNTTPTPPLSPKTYADFIKNTEWVGVHDGRAFQYPEPVDMKFNADSTVAMYSLFAFISNGVIRRVDSISGTIVKIDSMADGRTLITANFPDIGGDQRIYISGRNELVMSPSDPAQLTLNGHTFNLSLFPSAGISVTGTEWSGAIGPGSPGYQWVPDLSTIAFGSVDGTGKSLSSYTRQGVYIKQGIGDGGVVVSEISYRQAAGKGARVYMFGYNEAPSYDDSPNPTMMQGRLMPYFGVLLPSGDTMLVSSHSISARLPNYVQTNEYYGPKGVTPVIYKK